MKNIKIVSSCDSKEKKKDFSKVLQKFFLTIVCATTWHNFLSSEQLLFENGWVQ